ncbi:MAG: ATP-binding cassette domain-containing protein [Christensenellaceae bacterium]|jgi:putative ABC transport system permease protein|nr:ATP-binding cassette domain-containing protein [Christensenellaceae bacterium]
MLRLKNIVKNYNVGDDIVVKALKDVTLDFRKAEFVSILGPSGCGKTTLMNIIGGLDRATSGEITVNHRSTKSFDDSDWDNYRNKQIGFIFQNYYLIPHLSILANVELSLTLAGISKTERTARAMEALKSVDLEDQVNKRPNQLSGGQMQRVAIARALINNPEILLADEPTGALDTTTSFAIMELIKKISSERLVIMVTHNKELSENYSTRIIKMIDGKITDDSNPYNQMEDIKHLDTIEQARATDDISTVAKRELKKERKKSSMSFLTALTLSFKNLLTKKGRTLVTSIAGSIGIIGVSLILALSQGMNNYISKMQSDMMSSYPIQINTTALDISQLMSNAGSNSNSRTKFPDLTIQKLFPAFQQSRTTKNNITQDYIDYLKNPSVLSPSLYNDIIFKTGMTKRIFGVLHGSSSYVQIERPDSSFTQMINLDFLKTQYDVISQEGTMPSNINEVALVIDEYNSLTEALLYNLGLGPLPTPGATEPTISEIPFSEILGHEYKVLTNNDYYGKTDKNLFLNKTITEIDFDSENIITLKIVGILRVNKSTDTGVLNGGIVYFPGLDEHIQSINKASEIVAWMNDPENYLKNPYSGSVYTEKPANTAVEQWETELRGLGGISLPNSIQIYPKNFESKNQIKTILDNYNIGKATEDVIQYNDLSEMIISVMEQLVNIITYVLIGLTAISLVVSSVMISIITYVSVIERTKEIGILRSIGARKRDITRVFIAETFIIGFASGTIGVIIAYMLSLPINIIINSLTGITSIAALSPITAILMICVSIALMVLAGFLPAIFASKKDPVAALRTE